MSSIIRFFMPSEYVMRRYARRQVIGCIGGLIGLLLICLFFIALPWLANTLNSMNKDQTPWALAGAAVCCGGLMLLLMLGLLVLILRRRGGPTA
jgi:hypothetical protein